MATATRHLVQDLFRPLHALLRRGPTELGGDAVDTLAITHYLDGRMPPKAQAAFEQRLADSSELREEVASARAWLDDIAHNRTSAPTHLIGKAIADFPVRQPPWRVRIAEKATFRPDAMFTRRNYEWAAAALVLFLVCGTTAGYIRYYFTLEAPSVAAGNARPDKRGIDALQELALAQRRM